MRTIIQDLHYGLRLLVKSPVFTVAAILSLAIGIGANTAIFSLINEIFIRPLPVAVKNQKNLVRMFSRDQKDAHLENFSYPDYVDYKDKNPVFSDMLAYTPIERFSLQSGNKSEYIYGSRVSGNFFPLLGVQASSGRIITPDDDRASGSQPAAVVSYRLWKRFFNSDPSVIGREIKLNRTPLTIIGVAPERFTGIIPGLAFDIYVPLATWAQLKPDTDSLADRKVRWLELMARLKPGVSLSQAQAATYTRAQQLQLSYPDEDGPREIHVAAISEKHPGMKSEGATYIGILLAAMTILVLLIACANIANLLLARAIDRQKEIALRAALGASPRRITRQLLTEAMLLSLLGGAAGLILASWMTDILASAKLPLDLPIAMGFSLDKTVLAFTAVLSVLTGLLFGSLPTLHARRLDLTSAIKDQQQQTFRLFHRFGVRNLLIIMQIAGSLIMLVMAGLMLHSLKHSSKDDYGFKSDSLFLIPLDLNLSGYSKEQARQFNTRLLARIESLPGIYSAGRVSFPPLSMGRWRDPAFVPGYEFRSDDEKMIDNNTVTRDYFKTLNIPFVRGRDFSEIQAAEIIINETMARRFWPGQEALGREIRFGGPKYPARYVVGIVKDAVLGGTGTPAYPVAYMRMPENYNDQMTLIIRTIGSADRLIPEIRRIIFELDPDLPISNMRTLSEQLDLSLMQVRGSAWLLSLLGLLALGLASIGLYGVVSYAVNRRTHEIGIRIALGAQRSTVLRQLISEGVRLAAIGMIIGFILAQVIAHIVESVFNGISASDPLVYLGAGLLLVAVTLGACYIPARKAIKADPTTALRCE